MIGGLVQQQQIRIGQQQATHGRLAPLSAGQHSHRCVEPAFRKAQTQQGGPHPALVIETAHFLQLFPQSLLLLQQCRVGAALLQTGVDGGQLFLHRHDRSEHAFHLVPQRAGAVPAGVLFHIADDGIPVFDHLAAVRRFLSHEDPQQGGFAAAVIPHQADLVVVPDFKAQSCEQSPLPEVFIQLLCCQPCHGFLSLYCPKNGCLTLRKTAVGASIYDFLSSASISLRIAS